MMNKFFLERPMYDWKGIHNVVVDSIGIFQSCFEHFKNIFTK